MERKSFLLPHWCQKMGWWMLAAFLLFLVVALVVSSFDDKHVFEVAEAFDGLAFAILAVLPYAGLTFICISREKEEDEYIQYVRTRSAFWVVIVAFVFGMLKIAYTQFAARYFGIEAMQILAYVGIVFSIPTLAIVYLIIFKVSLFVNRMKSRKEEVSDGQ